MNRRQMLVRSTLTTILPGMGLVGCGGGETGETGTNTASLTPAKSFGEFTSKLFPDATSQTFLAPYDNDFNAFGAPATNITQGASPFQSGLYTNIAAENYPASPNGRFRITKDTIPRHGNISLVDLTNGVTGEGLAQSYYGVKSVTASPRVLPDGRNLANAGLVLFVELIATYKGVQLYRAIQQFTGFVYNWDTVDSTRDYPAGTLLFHGQYVETNIEIITQNANTPPLGVLYNYEDYIEVAVLA
jgi:hypothetical protein